MPGRRTTGFVIRWPSNIFAVARSCRTKLHQWQQARRSNYRDNRMTNSNGRPWLRISAFQPMTTLFPPILPSLCQNEINFFFPFPRHSKYFCGRQQNARIHRAKYIRSLRDILEFCKSRTIAPMNILMELYNPLFDWNIDLIIDR